MKVLALAVLLCAMMSLSSAFCYSKGDVYPDRTHCQDDSDKTWHAVGSKWRNSQCMDCTCSQCCSAYSTPVSFPDDCVSVFDSKECTYLVHKKDDPTVECSVFSAVGK